jgi:hypothetical protein
MKAFIFGLILIGAAVAVSLPYGLGWWPDVLAFLRGGLPVLGVMMGLLAFFIGIADIKDKANSKKEEAKGKS